MSPATRKIIYAVTFETGGILLGGLVLHLVSRAPLDHSLALSAMLRFWPLSCTNPA
jgi:hypothetical protein